MEAPQATMEDIKRTASLLPEAKSISKMPKGNTNFAGVHVNLIKQNKNKEGNNSNSEMLSLPLLDKT